MSLFTVSIAFSITLFLYVIHIFVVTLINYPLGFASGNTEGREETKPGANGLLTKLIVSRWASRQVFCYASLLNNRTNCEKNVCLMPASTQICYDFKEHDQIICGWKVQAVVVSLGSEFCSP